MPWAIRDPRDFAARTSREVRSNCLQKDTTVEQSSSMLWSNVLYRLFILMKSFPNWSLHRFSCHRRPSASLAPTGSHRASIAHWPGGWPGRVPPDSLGWSCASGRHTASPSSWSSMRSSLTRAVSWRSQGTSKWSHNRRGRGAHWETCAWSHPGSLCRSLVSASLPYYSFFSPSRPLLVKFFPPLMRTTNERLN